MKNPDFMTENPAWQKRDRLAAFFKAFDLNAEIIDRDAPDAAANLVVMDGAGGAGKVVYSARGDVSVFQSSNVLASAVIDFGGIMNPLVSAMPETIEINLCEKPMMDSLVRAFATEAQNARCGRQVALNRLCELIVLMILREAIDTGTTEPGLLAGLSHPALHRAIVAIHDAPAKPWRVEDLAEVSGLSRSQFADLFPKIVGTTPAAYLFAWRLALGRRQLLRGAPVKSAARYVGFSSAASFSRAYSRAFGQPPFSTKDRIQTRSS